MEKPAQHTHAGGPVQKNRRPAGCRPGVPPRLRVAGRDRRAGGRPASAGGAYQVFEASKMLWIERSSVASNSSSLCWAERPSESAREKLATMPFW